MSSEWGWTVMDECVCVCVCVLTVIVQYKCLIDSAAFLQGCNLVQLMWTQNTSSGTVRITWSDMWQEPRVWLSFETFELFSNTMYNTYISINTVQVNNCIQFFSHRISRKYVPFVISCGCKQWLTHCVTINHCVRVNKLIMCRVWQKHCQGYWLHWTIHSQSFVNCFMLQSSF